MLFQCFQGGQVAVGTNKGYVQIWDVAVSKKVHTLTGHGARVGQYCVQDCFFYSRGIQ